ncbi:MAG: hypothetical protein M1817_002747 [Caeruleum heppii]|nr:MAG: hypothetical protein M1817_002747 [Caeruleum heppii]
MSPPTNPKNEPVTFTSSERIKQLNDIDKDITTLLRSAGEAIRALTTSPTTQEPSTSSLSSHKTAFTASTASYFRLLSSIDVRLRRQIYALEEAAIIPRDAPAREATAATTGPAVKNASAVGGGGGGPRAGAQASETATSDTIGLGNLDVSWLNSRTKDNEDAMEAELWRKAREMVREWEERREEAAEGDMDVDREAGADEGADTDATKVSQGDAQAALVGGQRSDNDTAHETQQKAAS